MGLKLQPCSPTFVDARNAIIAADQAIGGKRFLFDLGGFAAKRTKLNIRWR
jgi:hypothetical protein